MRGTPIIIIAFATAFVGCKSEVTKEKALPKENIQAKQMLQGIWLEDDAGTPLFRAQGDTIYYPDSTSQPALFKIVNDTLIINNIRYPIIKQAEHLFLFKNPNGEEVKLVKSENVEEDMDFFVSEQAVVLNQNTKLSHDTLVTYDGSRYSARVNVEPTNQKVVRSSYNGDGIEVSNVYHDNVIQLVIHRDNRLIFSRHFYKKDFGRQVPSRFLKQCVLSDFVFENIDEKGLHHHALLCMPDNPSSYVVDLTVNKYGKHTFTLVD